MNRTLRTILIYGALVLVAVFVAQNWVERATAPEEVTVTQFQSDLDAGRVANVVILRESQAVQWETRGQEDGDPDFTAAYNDGYEEILTKSLIDQGIEYQVDAEPPSVFAILLQFLPWLFLIGFMVFIIFQMQGGGNRVMQFGKARAKQITKDMPKVTFDDVAGADEAVEELVEIKEFLENPKRFAQMGAKIPKGVLLYGPPGTGKTLLARAVAGEAARPFFSISGSDFVEMFVGVGAARVRDLFDQAKSNAPAIVFIDEIDAVGRHRGAGLGGGHDEREQTLNQLLVELDGFDVNTGVIVIAASNRPDILDPALLRPGRFDRQIVVDRPDLLGRKAILEVHAKGKPLVDDVDFEVLARQTPGFTGADLANLINEAALLAARHDQKKVSMQNLEDSIDRVIAGPERKSRLISDEEKLVIAYHESGHALVGWALPMADPIHKVTIIPRGRSLGHTQSLPEQDKYIMKRSELVDQLAMLLGGRTAEELIFVDPSTGAANDIDKATEQARKMVMEYGMSDRLGPMKYGQATGEVFLGRDYARQQDYSDEVASFIDEEVRKLIGQAHEEARQILATHRDALDKLANLLIERETIDSDDVAEILADVPKWEHDSGGAMRIRMPVPEQAGPKGVAAAQSES
ncbi:MAG: ATP-dependent zinc metalloprotease FtsH [Acidimicrobiia bacterium]